MENKINIAELLKDCPNGMELDCTVYNNCILKEIVEECFYPVRIKTPEGIMLLTKYGSISTSTHSKCVIFPKGKTTWDNFVPPCKFKDGDVVATNNGAWIGIITGGESGRVTRTYCAINSNGALEAYLYIKDKWVFDRLATKEEKQKLFDVIKTNGYKWNAETKTLEKLVEPKFKVGGRVRHKETNKDDVYEISKVYDDSYGLVGFTWMIYMKYQDQYELVPNKFDITTLKPLESKVLMRSSNAREWVGTIFSHYSNNKFYGCGMYCDQCIPYEGNEHLLGTTDDCNNYYKTWE